MRQYRKGVGFVMDEARHFTPLDRNQKARIIHVVETFERTTKAKGRRNGDIGIPATIILRMLLNGFHNARSGRCCPSYETIRKRTGFCRATIAKALAALERLGVLVITRRLVRVRSAIGEVVVRNGSNLYGFQRAAAPHADHDAAGEASVHSESIRDENEPHTHRSISSRTYARTGSPVGE